MQQGAPRRRPQVSAIRRESGGGRRGRGPRGGRREALGETSGSRQIQPHIPQLICQRGHVRNGGGLVAVGPGGGQERGRREREGAGGGSGNSGSGEGRRRAGRRCAPVGRAGRRCAAAVRRPGRGGPPPGPVRHPRGLWQRNSWTRPSPSSRLPGPWTEPWPPCKRRTPGRHRRTAGRTATYTGSTRRFTRGLLPPGGWNPAIRHKALNGRDSANYAGCIRFAHVRAARVSGTCSARAPKGSARWLNRVPWGGRPPYPTT